MNVKEIIESFEPNKDNLLPLLHALQDNHPQNYLPNETLRLVAKHMNITLSSVFGVVGYYTMFSTKPRGRYVVRICNSPVCHMADAESIMSWAEGYLGVKLGQTTPDGLFTLEESECLGRCGKSPSMMINREFYGNVSRISLAEIFESFKANGN